MQAFVVRVTIPDSIDDLRGQIQFHLGDQDSDMFGQSDLEMLLSSSSTDWSVPKHVMDGDIIMFQVSANARSKAKRLLPQLEALPDDDPDYVGMSFGLMAAERYAGRVVSIGRIAGQASFDTAGPHFRSRHYADVVDLQEVDVEVIGKKPFSQWPEFKAHGPVAYRQFTSDERYREFISMFDGVDEPLPSWVTREPVTVYNNIKVSRDTWMGMAQRSDFGFALENAVRFYYADWLLRDLSDRRILYAEVAASGPDVRDGWVDNVILVDNMPVPVEVKINAQAESHLFDQLNRYRNATQLTTKSKTLADRHHDIVLLVDQTGIYITDSSTTDLGEPSLAREDTTEQSVLKLRGVLEQRVAEKGAK